MIQPTPTSLPGSQVQVSLAAIPQPKLNENEGVKTKAESDLFDHLTTFHSLQIYKHDIDKIKTDDRVQAADQVIKTTNRKLCLGIHIIEFILKERLIFIQQSQQNEASILQVMDDVVQLCSVETMKDLQLNQLDQQLNKFKMILISQFALFDRLNMVINHLDLDKLHTLEWKVSVRKSALQNGYVLGLLDLSLIDCSNCLYHKMKKQLLNLQQICGDVDLNTDKLSLNDEQISKLLNYLMDISEDFKNNTGLHLQIIKHQWLEDVIRVESGFQINYHKFYECLAQLQSELIGTILTLQNLGEQIKSINNRSQKALRILKRVVLPQKYDNLNLTYSVQCQELLNKNIISIGKTKERLNSTLQIEVYRYLANDSYEVYKPVGAFKGALRLNLIDITLLDELLRDSILNMVYQMNDTQIELSGVNLLYSRFKELLVAEKKVAKAQSLYVDLMAMVEGYTFNQEKIDQTEFYGAIIKLQKYINLLSEYQHTALTLSEILPKISDFVLLLQKFVSKSVLLTNDALLILKIN